MKKKYENNKVVALIGNKGNGKTLVMTLLLYIEYLKGKKIYTNYKVFFPHEILDVQKMVELDVSLQDAVIGIDEMQTVCDSRKHSRKQNILMSHFLIQTRHRSINLYYTTTYLGQVDKRIRENTDIVIISENLEVDSDKDGYDDMFRIIVRDERHLKMKVKTKIIYGKPVFDLYSTDYIVDIFSMKEIKHDKE